VMLFVVTPNTDSLVDHVNIETLSLLSAQDQDHSALRT